MIAHRCCQHSCLPSVDASSCMSAGLSSPLPNRCPPTLTCCSTLAHASLFLHHFFKTLTMPSSHSSVSVKQASTAKKPCSGTTGCWPTFQHILLALRKDPQNSWCLPAICVLGWSRNDFKDADGAARLSSQAEQHALPIIWHYQQNLLVPPSNLGACVEQARVAKKPTKQTGQAAADSADLDAHIPKVSGHAPQAHADPEPEQHMHGRTDHSASNGRIAEFNIEGQHDEDVFGAELAALRAQESSQRSGYLVACHLLHECSELACQTALIRGFPERGMSLLASSGGHASALLPCNLMQESLLFHAVLSHVLSQVRVC